MAFFIALNMTNAWLALYSLSHNLSKIKCIFYFFTSNVFANISYNNFEIEKIHRTGILGAYFDHQLMAHAK